MTRMKKLVLAALVAFAVAAGGVSYTSQLAGDPSQWGVAKKGSFDITELELLASGDDNNGDVPVVPGVAYVSDGKHIPKPVLT